MGRYSGKKCRLLSMFALTSSFFLVEIIVGYVTNSMALVADSFHMLSDVAALIVAFLSVMMSPRKWSKNTFGWARAEVLGALVNAVFLVALCFSILVESLKRFYEVETIHRPDLILYVGALGLLVNIMGLALFHRHGHADHRPQVAKIHDMIGDEDINDNEENFLASNSHQEKSMARKQMSHSHHDTGPGTSNEISDNGVAGVQNTNNVPDTNEVKPNTVPDTTAEVKTVKIVETTSELEPNKVPHTIVEVKTEPAPVVHHIICISNEISKSWKGKNDQFGNFIRNVSDFLISSSSGQLNMRGVFLHILADALGSVIVIISALVIWLTDWKYKYYVDPSLSIVMVVLIMRSTWPLLVESALILLQTVPTHIQVDAIQDRLLKQIDGVLAVHEFHVWQLAGDRIIASAHIRCRNLADYMRIAEKVKEFFHNEGIHSTTIQPEFVEYQDESDTLDCMLDCPPNTRCSASTCCGPTKDSPRLSLPIEGSETVRQRISANTTPNNMGSNSSLPFTDLPTAMESGNLGNPSSRESSA